uniref:Uncharacterized protein n=1 Tax=Rhizophora mucronata TaxID=61149 RepID=A0A2P2NCE8_RHIMU
MPGIQLNIKTMDVSNFFPMKT